MPPRIQPKTYIISFKTHKLTVLTSVARPEKTTIADLKLEALSALQADVLRNKSDGDGDVNMDVDLDSSGEWEVPKVQDVDDFELSRALKDRGRMTGQFEVLGEKETIKQSLVNWETVFIRFKDENGALLPVNVAMPSIADEEEEEVPVSTSKGKRKAGPQDFMD